MPIKFLGQDTVVTFQDYLNAGALLIGLCRRTTEIERIRETIETTTLEGQEVGHVLGLKRGRFTMNALSIFNEIGEQSANDEQLRQWFEAGTLLYVQVLDAKGDMERLIDFYSYIERYRIVRNNNEGANVDVDLLWTQPDPYDLPLLACPTVTVTRGLNSILLEFNGVEGTEYTFELLSPAQTIVVTEPPFEALFTGLTPSTSYTIEVSVSQYGLDSLTCSTISTSTLSATMGVGYGGADVEGACEQTYEVTFYYTGTFGIGTLLYEDAELTVPFNDYAFVKFSGVVFGITAGEVSSNEGACVLVVIENNLSGSEISSVQKDGVNFLDIITGTFPISSGSEVTANHTGFTGSIEVIITGSFTFGSLSLIKNGVFQECIDVNGTPGTYVFSSLTFLSTDTIFISLNEGSCV